MNINAEQKLNYIVTMQHEELKTLIVDVIKKKLKDDGYLLPDNLPNSEFKLDIEQQTEGSPSYLVSRWNAMVRVVQHIPVTIAVKDE